MIINHNMNAMNAHRFMTGNTAAAGKSMEKLSSGLRINRAGDDAAGLAISEKMRGQIRGLDQASRNAQDGISMIQTAEGALNETHSILQRMRELAVQGSNTTNTADDRKEIQKEMNEMVDEIDRIANTTEFNTTKLLDGSLDSTKKTSTTAATATQTIAVSGIDLGGTNGVIDAAHNSVKIVYGGQEIELNGLTSKTYNGTAAGGKIEDFAADLQKLIDSNDTLKGKVTVEGVQINANNATLTFKSDKEVEIQQAQTNSITLSQFGLTGAPASFEQNYKLQGTSMDYDTAGAGAAAFSIQASSTGIVVNYNGQDITLDLTAASYSGTTATTGVGGLAEDVMQAINGNTTLKGHVSAVNENGKLTFYSDKELKISTGVSMSHFDSIGFASGTEAVAVKPEASTDSTTAGGEAITLQIGANQGQTLDVNISKMDSSSIGSSADNTKVDASALHYDYTVKGGGIAANVAITSAANSFKITYGGKDYSIEGLSTRTYDYTSETEMKALVADINSKINAQSDLAGGHIQASYNSKGITFTADKDFEITSADKNAITLSTSFGITSGTSAVEGKYMAQGTAVSSFNEALAANTNAITVKYNGSNTKLAFGNLTTSYAGDFSGFVDKVQSMINADATLKGHVTAELVDDKLTFVSDKEFSLVSMSGGISEADMGFTAGQAATVQEKTGAAAADANATVKGLKVDDVNSGTGGVLTKTGAQSAITIVDTAIKQVSAERAKLGAYQNRLEHTINNLGTASENLTSAESRIRDVDMAKEMMTFSKNNILSQAAQAMLAQANQHLDVQGPQGEGEGGYRC